jgi:hypothetical protein
MTGGSSVSDGEEGDRAPPPGRRIDATIVVIGSGQRWTGTWKGPIQR